MQSLIDQLPLGPGVEVITSNADGLVALNKPEGILSHPNSKTAEIDRKRSLLVADYAYEQECFTWTDTNGVSRNAWLINRLDSPTSGVILITLDESLAEILKQQFATHHVTKIYYAVVRSMPKGINGEWRDRLKKNVYSGKKVIKGGVTVPAKTRYQIAKTTKGDLSVSLLKLMPVTGRTHQLRVQCANHGHPIVGDRNYGSFSFNKEIASKMELKRMLLHSAETTVRYVYNGEARVFTAQAKLPDVFMEPLNYHEGRYRPEPIKRVLPKAKPKIMRHQSASSRLKARRFRA